MRPSALPKLNVALKTDSMSPDQYSDMWDSPVSITSSHSRASSGASDCDSPLTQNSSYHEHTRFPSSGSATTMSPPTYEYSEDSPTRVQKTTTLDDLVEDPYERDDELDLCHQDSITLCECKYHVIAAVKNTSDEHRRAPASIFLSFCHRPPQPRLLARRRVQQRWGSHSA